MPRKAAGFTAAKVKTAPPGRYVNAKGHYLLVRSVEARFWLCRYTLDGKIREMGLGRAWADKAVVMRGFSGAPTGAVDGLGDALRWDEAGAEGRSDLATVKQRIRFVQAA